MNGGAIPAEALRFGSMGYRGEEQAALAAARTEAAVGVCAKLLPALIARRQARIGAFAPAALAGACVVFPALCRVTWTQWRFFPTFEDPAFGLAAAVFLGVVGWLGLRIVLKIARVQSFANRLQNARTSGNVAEMLRAELAAGARLGRASITASLLALAVLAPYGVFAVPTAIFGASPQFSSWILQGGSAALVAHLVLVVSAVRQGRRQSATAFGAALPLAMLAAALVVVPGLVLDPALAHHSQFAAMVVGLMIATATGVGLQGLLGWPVGLTVMSAAITRDDEELARCRAACAAIDQPLRIEDLSPTAAGAAGPAAEEAFLEDATPVRAAAG